MKPYSIANWKMNLNEEESRKLVAKISVGLPKISGQVIFCPSYPNLRGVIDLIAGKSKLACGAQDVFFGSSGAVTGEVSADMLSDLGCRYVIVGHSERRINFGETDEDVNKKIKACLEHKLIPIICIGENFKEKQKKESAKVVSKQLKGALKGVDSSRAELIIVYEPAWTISTNKKSKPASWDDIASIKKIIKSQINDVPVVYGGSVNSSNVANFVGRDKLDGVLVGSASLDGGEFTKIVKEVEKEFHKSS